MHSVGTGEGGDVLHVAQRLVVHRTVVNLDLVVLGCGGVEPAQGVLHPLVVQAVREVLPCMCATALLAGLRGVDSDGGVDEQVVQLTRFRQIRVPHQAPVRQPNVVEGLHHLVNTLLALLQRLLRPEHRCVLLHDTLHLAADLGGGQGALAVPELLQPGDGLITGAIGQRRLLHSRLDLLTDSDGAGATEHDNVQQAVGP
mmetsp:Transcript_6966/g.20338  ORF Transcript_6966/g.20338 Transcript_6966/m.20338 type:complete len:200 (+) Transcript_6966:1007-1606(+)